MKRKKIIWIIVLILIFLILITRLSVNINKIVKMQYFSTANPNSNLLSEYIKSGITIGGVTGSLVDLDTSDATATPEDIAKGKTAYVNGVKITGTYIENTLGNVTGNEKENTIVNDKYGNEIVVPSGFKIVNPDDCVTDGIIIEDVSAGDEYTKGSQFVWIPLGNIIINENGDTDTITLGRYTFDKGSFSNFTYTGTGKATIVQSYQNWTSEIEIEGYNAVESATSTYGNATAKNLEKFINQATTSSWGYYIGRYELGDAKATNSSHSSSGTSNPVTCKAGVYPYNYITQPQASELCKNMYDSTYFQSDLVNGYAWDTAVVFIQKFSGDSDYSIQIGRNQSNSVRKAGDNILWDNKVDVRSNIYDMASGTWEWTTSTGHKQGSYCIARGGIFGVNSQTYTSNYGAGDKNLSTINVSCRPIIYLEK